MRELARSPTALPWTRSSQRPRRAAFEPRWSNASPSTRLRGAPNGYNQLRFDGELLEIVHRVWDGTAFRDDAMKSYQRRQAPDRFVKVADSPTRSGMLDA